MSGTAEWGTPPELFALLHRRFQFDYDAFASHENALCPVYSTVDGTYQQRGPCRCSEPEWCSDRERRSSRDGLDFDWSGRRVFLNPPYSRGLIDRCVAKAYEERHRAAIVVALLPANTETDWFQRYVLPHCHIYYLPKRPHFIHPNFKCSETCDHAQGRPAKNPKGAFVVATFKTELMP